MAIRDVGLLNNMLGAKLLWNINKGEEASWKDVMSRKYSHVSHIQNMDCSFNEDTCTHVRNLCRGFVDVLKNNTS